MRSARVSTLGKSVVGAFYLTDRAGRLITDPELRADIEIELRGI